MFVEPHSTFVHWIFWRYARVRANSLVNREWHIISTEVVLKRAIRNIEGARNVGEFHAALPQRVPQISQGPRRPTRAIDLCISMCIFHIMHQISRIFHLVVAPSPELYLMVRAGFVAKGTTLNAWCIANGVNRQTVERALKGARNGKVSRELRERAVAAALVEEQGAA